MTKKIKGTRKTMIEKLDVPNWRLEISTSKTKKLSKGKHKIQDKWKDGIYKVINQPIREFSSVYSST